MNGMTGNLANVLRLVVVGYEPIIERRKSRRPMVENVRERRLLKMCATLMTVLVSIERLRIEIFIN